MSEVKKKYNSRQLQLMLDETKLQAGHIKAAYCISVWIATKGKVIVCGERASKASVVETSA